MTRFDHVQAPYGIGTCRECSGQYTLTKRGTIRRHGPHGGPHCAGSGQRPKQHARAVETVDTRGLT